MAAARRCSPLLQALGVAAFILVLTRPLVFDGYQRGADFWVHYWYVWHQGEAVRHGGPSLFIYDAASLFVPRYAFYGGTLYAITGALGVLTGSMLGAYMATYLLGCAAAYGGWWWLGRQAGLSRLVAHAPAALFVSSPYAITLLNPRSDWPEYIGVSMLPLLAASALSVLRADRLRLGPMLALTVSSVVFVGSHNLTLLCGATLLGAVAVLSVLCIPQARRMVTRRGVLRLAAVLVPAVLVNAWFLLPDLVYQSHTLIAQLRPLWKQWLHQFSYLIATPRLFALDRSGADVSFGAFALPVLAMAWTLAALAISRPGLRQPWLRMLLILAAVTTATAVAMTHAGLLHGPFAMLQYAFRLESYVNLTITGAVLAALVLVTGRSGRAARLCVSALVVVVAISAVQAARQVDVHRDASNNVDLTADPSYYAPEGLTHTQDYAVGDIAVIDVTGLTRLNFPVGEVRDGSLSGTVVARAGDYLLTNLVTMPQFIKMTGAHTYAVDENGNMVIRIDRGVRPGPVRITVSEHRPPAVRIGAWLSILGLLGLAAELVVIAARWWRRRRAGRRSDRPGTGAVGEQPSAVAVG
jgi:hypothetical protein